MEDHLVDIVAESVIFASGELSSDRDAGDTVFDNVWGPVIDIGKKLVGKWFDIDCESAMAVLGQLSSDRYAWDTFL